MNAITKLFGAEKPEPTRSSDPGLEPLLLDLLRFGKPRISFVGRGWYCNIEMATQGSGVKFEVSSEFGHKTPMDAAVECSERVRNAVKAAGEA